MHHNKPHNQQNRNNQYNRQQQTTTGQYGIQQSSPYGNPQQTQQNYNQNQYNQTQTNQPQMIKNPESNVVSRVKNPSMNDRDYINDILATEKYLTDSFNTFVREASHTELYNDTKQILNETHDCTRDIFNVMFKNGFYSLQPEKAQAVQKAQKQFANYINAQDPYSG